MGKTAIDLGGYTSTKRTMYAAHPNALEFFDEDNHSRDGEPVQIDDELLALAKVMAETPHLIPPVQVYRTKDGKLRGFIGFRRHRAACYIAEHENPDFQLNYIIADRMSPEEREIANFHENYNRKDLSDYQIAKFIKRQMDKGGKTQVEVAKMLGISQGRVSQINKLNNQPEAIQNAVKNGQLAGTAVIEFDAATDDVQANILELLKDNPDIKITAEQIKNLRLEAQEIAQRESEAGDDADADSYDPINPADPTEEEDEASGADQEEAAPESAPARTKVVGRTIKHVKEFMEGKQGPLDNANGKKLAKMINDFIAGTKSAEQLERCWNKIFPDVESS